VRELGTATSRFEAGIVSIVRCVKYREVACGNFRLPPQGIDSTLKLTQCCISADYYCY